MTIGACSLVCLLGVPSTQAAAKQTVVKYVRARERLYGAVEDAAEEPDDRQDAEPRLEDLVDEWRDDTNGV